MPKFALPRAAASAEIPRDVRLQIASASADPPTGDGWLHEVKHDGHRLVAIVAGESLKLLSRNGHDRTALLREPFLPLQRRFCGVRYYSCSHLGLRGGFGQFWSFRGRHGSFVSMRRSL